MITGHGLTRFRLASPFFQLLFCRRNLKMIVLSIGENLALGAHKLGNAWPIEHKMSKT